MEPRPLLIVLAAVFAGLATVLVVAATVTATPLVLLAAVPLALTAGLLWYQGTGRLAVGLVGGGRRRRRRAGPRATVGRTSEPGGGGEPGGAGDAGGPGGTADSGGERDPWEDPFWREAEREARYRARRQARRRTDAGTDPADDGTATAGSGRDGAWRSRRERADRLGGLTTAEAYDVLGLDPTATDEEVREAYRERAKQLHPDTEGGSAEEFQRLNDAYERLVDE